MIAEFHHRTVMLVIRQRGQSFRVADGKRHKKKGGMERKEEKGRKQQSLNHTSTLTGYITKTY